MADTPVAGSFWEAETGQRYEILEWSQEWQMVRARPVGAGFGSEVMLRPEDFGTRLHEVPQVVEES